MNLEKASRDAIAAHQRSAFEKMLAEMLPANRFYAAKLGRCEAADGWDRLPFTTKEELLDDQRRHPPYGTLLTYPRERYTRVHQTSGTRDAPLRWLDTPASWNALLDCWRELFAMAGVTPTDRLAFAFSFGPFLGFWTAFEAAQRLGCFCLATGGMSTAARLRLILDHQATVLLCTPTYALHLAQVAAEQGLDLRRGCVTKIIVAGEPGGSIPATRARIEQAWRARVHDHHGMTEVGPMTMECTEAPGGLHVLESAYVVEVIDPATLQPAAAGQVGELVVTNLHRWGSPLIRYRTGDLVRIDPQPCPCGRSYFRLAGGILGRTDDLLTIRGHKVYPGALENLVRRFSDIAEYRVTVDATATLAELRIEIEPTPTCGSASVLGEKVAAAIRDELLLRADVEVVSPGTLPRFEMKARRVRIKHA
ncbi:MAG: AMP-binding protein [Gemmataceae bacterium]|nr:AMP-binding protein [Gemmataceae bacterium]